MRAVVQRVKNARVEVNGKTVGEIGRGLLVLLGVELEDTEKDSEYLADKIARLRIFSDERGLMNLSLIETGGAVLVVSQFTLLGIVRGAADPPLPVRRPGRGEHTLSGLRRPAPGQKIAGSHWRIPGDDGCPSGKRRPCNPHSGQPDESDPSGCVIRCQTIAISPIFSGIFLPNVHPDIELDSAVSRSE